MSDPYRLQRFLDAQESIFDNVCSELRAGRKVSHWMWFIFPQLAGLGSSLLSLKYAITSLDEARAYVEHPVLGPRLRHCADLALSVDGLSARQIFGNPDDLKFRSSMTLFSRATTHNAIFIAALRKYFAGHEDPLTIELLTSNG